MGGLLGRPSDQVDYGGEGDAIVCLVDLREVVEGADDGGAVVGGASLG